MHPCPQCTKGLGEVPPGSARALPCWLVHGVPPLRQAMLRGIHHDRRCCPAREGGGTGPPPGKPGAWAWRCDKHHLVDEAVLLLPLPLTFLSV